MDKAQQPLAGNYGVLALPLALVVVLLVLLCAHLHKCQAQPPVAAPVAKPSQSEVQLTTAGDAKKALDHNVQTVKRWCALLEDPKDPLVHARPALEELWNGYDRLAYQDPPDPEADYYIYETLYPLEDRFLALASAIDSGEPSDPRHQLREDAKTALWELTVNVRLLGVSLELE